MIKLPLVGEFQIENALVAAGLAIGTGSDPGAVFATLAQLEGAKGGWSGSANITARDLRRLCAQAGRAGEALQALRPYAKRKLVVVSAPAAIATPASARSWARSRPRMPIASSSPTTIAQRNPTRSAPRSWPKRKAPTTSRSY